MTPNINPTTGIRYGAISGNSLHPDMLTELYTHASAAASEQLETERREELLTQLCDAIHEILPNVALGGQDASDLVEQQVEIEVGRGDFDVEEPSAEIEYGGVKLHYGYLGGAPLLLVLDSPHTTRVRSLCSPCVPNAADLDSPPDLDGYLAYSVPADWLNPEN